MPSYSFFNKETGEVHPVQFHSRGHDVKAIELNTPEGHEVIEGVIDPLSYRVDPKTRELVDWKPEQPSEDHEWDGSARRWTLKAEAAARINAENIARSQIVETEQQSLRAIREALILQYDGVSDEMVPEAVKRLRTTEQAIAEKRADIKPRT
jgi:hypothetical protein